MAGIPARPSTLKTRIAEVVDGMGLSTEQRAELHRRLEACFDAAECARGTGPDERIEALSARVRAVEERLAQARRVEAIGWLTGGIAHDFNNLLTGILGYSSLLTTFLPENGKERDAAATIDRSARRAAELTRHLLAYARRGTPAFRPVDLRDVIAEAIEILSRSINGNVEIRTDFQPPTGPVMADPEALLHAMLHLGINASDAMPGGGHLTFSASLFVSGAEVRLDGVPVPEGRHVSVCVSDTGRGIPEAIREDVFTPFFTTKTPGEGMGAGLSIVRGCVRAHGGLLRLVRREGIGATFQILLPLAGGGATTS